MYALIAAGLLIIVALGTNRWTRLHTPLFHDPLSHPCETTHATYEYEPPQRTLTANPGPAATGSTSCIPYRYTLCISNGGVNARTTHFDPSDLRDVGLFPTFVELATDHVLSEFANEIPCKQNPAGPPPIELIFVYLPLFFTGDMPSPPPNIAPPALDAGCYLKSPWAEISFERSPAPKLRAVFIWNDRQFLRDQVDLSDPPDPLPGLPAHIWDEIRLTQAVNTSAERPMPLPWIIWEQLIWIYAGSENSKVQRFFSPQDRQTALEQIPTDLMWLFRQAHQHPFVPPDQEMDRTMQDFRKRISADYTHLAIKLVDQCMSLENSQFHYERINDLDGIVKLDEYRIHSLR